MLNQKLRSAMTIQPHLIALSSAGAPAFDAINWMTLLFAQLID
jgi:hypothetical protein